MTQTKKETCPGCGAETYAAAPPCDCGGGWYREPSFYYWPVQSTQLQGPCEGLDNSIPF